MSDQTVLIDQFLSSVISTIHPDEIFDSIIDTAVRLLSPDGLLLTIRDDVSPSYHVTRSFGDITWEKDSFLDSSILLEQLLNADSYIPFMPGAGLPAALDGISSHTRSWLIQQNIIGVYCLKYNRALIGFLFIALHNHMPLSADQVSALCKIGFYATHALRNANLYMNAYRASITDDLTALYNRKHAFEMIDELCLSGTPCSLIMLDIDDFKRINDLYSHDTGDEALRSLANDLREAFPAPAIVGRNGGDEFCIFLPDCTAGEARFLLQRFSARDLTFTYGDQQHAYTISIGYTTYPSQGISRTDLFRCADAALYAVKLHGKHGVRLYAPSIAKEDRSQLAFGLKDIIMHFPGAILIYKATGKEEILFANNELIRLFDCQTLEEFQQYTGGTFRSIVHPEEYEAVEQSIWEQVQQPNSDGNDAVRYRIITKSGQVKCILDKGRLVETDVYGKVFYVLMIDESNW